MDTFTIHAEQVNVQDIMKEIHRRVLEKKQRGVYNDDELRRIAELKSDLSPKQNANLNEMNLHLRRLPQKNRGPVRHCKRRPGSQLRARPPFF